MRLSSAAKLSKKKSRTSVLGSCDLNLSMKNLVSSRVGLLSSDKLSNIDLNNIQREEIAKNKPRSALPEMITSNNPVANLLDIGTGGGIVDTALSNELNTIEQRAWDPKAIERKASEPRSRQFATLKVTNLALPEQINQSVQSTVLSLRHMVAGAPVRPATKQVEMLELLNEEIVEKEEFE